MRKIKINGKIIELTECCRWGTKEMLEKDHLSDTVYFPKRGKAKKVLFNKNLNIREAVDGDLVHLKIDGKFVVDEVVGYTCGQVIPTKNHGTIVLSMVEVRPHRWVEILHKNNVEFVK